VWVANHTAWDHAWVTQHPDWYQKDASGQIHSYTFRPSPEAEPEYWTDVVGLDYAQPALWRAMNSAVRSKSPVGLTQRVAARQSSGAAGNGCSGTFA